MLKYVDSVFDIHPILIQNKDIAQIKISHFELANKNRNSKYTQFMRLNVCL